MQFWYSRALRPDILRFGLCWHRESVYVQDVPGTSFGMGQSSSKTRWASDASASRRSATLNSIYLHFRYSCHSFHIVRYNFGIQGLLGRIFHDSVFIEIATLYTYRKCPLKQIGHTRPHLGRATGRDCQLGAPPAAMSIFQGGDGKLLGMVDSYLRNKITGGRGRERE